MPDQTISVLRRVDDRVIPVAGVYEIDAPHTSVEFVGRHLMITKVRGRFSDVRGQITIAEDPKDSHVEAVQRYFFDQLSKEEIDTMAAAFDRVLDNLKRNTA